MQLIITILGIYIQGNTLMELEFGFCFHVIDFVRNLIGRKKHIAAITFICAFKLTDIAKPEAIFKQYLDDNISDIHRKGNNSSDAKACQFSLHGMIWPLLNHRVLAIDIKICVYFLTPNRLAGQSHRLRSKCFNFLNRMLQRKQT